MNFVAKQSSLDDKEPISVQFCALSIAHVHLKAHKCARTYTHTHTHTKGYDYDENGRNYKKATKREDVEEEEGEKMSPSHWLIFQFGHPGFY